MIYTHWKLDWPQRVVSPRFERLHIDIYYTKLKTERPYCLLILLEIPATLGGQRWMDVYKLMRAV